ncbi:DUF1772 domain-containing protein [Vallicoccus soli]|uniref:DUF1772 domain-containing protein n=1 Tax=Vallicoccus soli TaxID=2339232 RepID=A0A3A3ZLS0_9ACTN|nr:anthrone oxygenase family protein [Vallicoccus soli]RJK97246.1 DUF1772 domain-containing protein [Vallicoccus soli]
MAALALATGTGCALVGGVLFAFSGFVLPALARLPGGRGAEAMRSVNLLAVRPPLMLALLGTAAGCAVLGVLAWRRGEPLVVAGCAAYLVGVVGVTVVANVPLNDRLADGRVAWDAYVAAWGRWNHVRTLSGVVAAVLVLAR